MSITKVTLNDIIRLAAIDPEDMWLLVDLSDSHPLDTLVGITLFRIQISVIRGVID